MKLHPLLLLAASVGACTVVNDPFQPRLIEALRDDAGSSAPAAPDASTGPATEPAPAEATPPETMVSAPDAGGSCSGAAELAGCELPQLTPEPPPPTCSDNLQNQGEADADCGGPCAPCNDGRSCAAAADCASGFCSAAGRCALATCSDGERNGSETGDDCGGACSPCPVGSSCSVPTDCETGVCQGGACAAATCTDQVRNQDEVDQDCGGSCGPCLPGARCTQPSDCSEGVCEARDCAAGVELCCQPARCNDDVRNGNEPFEDCGAAPCPLCPLGNPCNANAQCASNRCLGGSCAPPPCSDGVQNGSESDEDCGGNDPACRRCALGEECNGPADCASGSCLAGRCADCNDEQRDGDETDTDCGGSCGPCAAGQACEADADCARGVCVDDRCCGGQQVDCTRCARRLVNNISCATSGAAAQPSCDAFLQCLQDNPASCGSRLAVTCTSAGAVCDPALFGGVGSPGVALADMILGTAQCQF